MNPSQHHAAPRPVVAITADRGEQDGHATHQAFDGYVRAVYEVSGALPLVLPAARAAIDAASARLIAPDQMGTLFRVLAVGDDRSAAPVGFSDTPSD